MLAPVPPRPGPVGTHGDPVRPRARRVSPAVIAIVRQLGRGHDEPFTRGAGRQIDRRELEPPGELQRPGVERRAARLQHVARFRVAPEDFDRPHPMRLRSPTHPRHLILDESHVQRAPVPRREEIVRVRAVASIARGDRVDVAGANGLQRRTAGGRRAARRRRRRRRESRRRGRVRIVAAGRDRAEHARGGGGGEKAQTGRRRDARRQAPGLHMHRKGSFCVERSTAR